MRDFIYSKLNPKQITIENDIHVEEIDKDQIEISFTLFDKEDYPGVEEFFCKIYSPVSRFRKVVKIDFESNSRFTTEISISDLSNSLQIEVIGTDNENDIIYRSNLFDFDLDYNESNIDLVIIDFETEVSDEFRDLFWYFEPGNNNINLFVNKKYKNLIKILTNPSVPNQDNYVLKFISIVLLLHYKALKTIIPFKRGVDFLFENEDIFSDFHVDFLDKIKEAPNFLKESLLVDDDESLLEEVFPHLYSNISTNERARFFYQYFAYVLLSPIKNQILEFIKKA